MSQSRLAFVPLLTAPALSAFRRRAALIGLPKLVGAAIVLLAGCAGEPGTTPRAAPQRPRAPNILLVLADDMGIDASPCYTIGLLKPVMPTLEGLCQSGLVFENAWAAPECSPSRAAILTGRYGFRTGVGSALSPNSPGISLAETSIQRYLDARAPVPYAHAVIGKWHLSTRSNGDRSNPELMGVGDFAGLLSGSHDDYFRWDRTSGGQTRQVSAYSTTVFTDDAAAWVRRQSGPWFLWLAYTAPHSPYHLPPPELHGRTGLAGTAEDVQARPMPYFLAMMEALDLELGRLLGSLDPQARENTLVLFMGDNGTPGNLIQAFDRRRAKSTVYEGGVRVPLIAAGAGVTRRGEREPALVNAVDLFATIAEAAGTGSGTIHDSISFLPLLADARAARRSVVYTEFFGSGSLPQNHGWAIRDDRYKLVRLDNGMSQLFDLARDPFEARDLITAGLAGDERLALDKLDRLAAELRRP